MTRFRIHWSIRWAIRLVYGLVIIALLSYLGIGYFLKTRLADRLLVNQFSSRVGHAVRVREVSMEWLRGFHLVLKDVEIPASRGAPPWLTCKRLVATLEIWPFLSRKKIVFSHLSVEDGTVRLVRRRDGAWEGAFPAPVPAPKEMEKPRLVEPSRGEKGGFTFFLPRVDLRRVRVEAVYETENKTRCVKIFIRSGRTRFKDKKISGEITGDFKLCEKATPTDFFTRFHYTLNPRFPLRASLKLSNLNLKDLEVFGWKSSTWKLRGMTDLSLIVEGELRKIFKLRGTLVARNTFFEKAAWRFSPAEETIAVQFEGGRKRSEPGGFVSFVRIGLPALPLEIRRFAEKEGGRQTTKTLHLVLKPLTLHGKYHPRKEQITFSLESPPAKGKDISGGISATGALTLKGLRTCTLAFSYTRFPLKEVLDFFHEKEQASDSAAAIPEPAPKFPLHVLDEVSGNLSGEFNGDTLAIRTAILSVARREFRVEVRAAPFSLGHAERIRLHVSARKVPVTFLKDTPQLLEMVPVSYRPWCRAVRGGLLAEVEGDISLQRDGRGRLKGIKAHAGVLKAADVSIALPDTGMRLTQLYLDAAFKTPGAWVKEFRCAVEGDNSLEVKNLRIRDVYRKPLEVEGKATFRSSGIDLRAGDAQNPLGGFVVSKLPETLPFVPEYFEGKVVVRFDGALSPFSYRAFEITLQGVKVQALTKARGNFPALPVTLLASGRASPENIALERVSLVTPVGGVVAGGTVKTDSTGTRTVNISLQGNLIAKEGTLQSYFPSLKPSVRLAGTVPISLQAQGTWPNVFLQGHLEMTGLTLGYKNFFLKGQGVPSFVDFQITQTGERAFKISWIRGKFGQFIIKLWGGITSLKPFRGEIRCQTDTRQFRALLPLFPRLCKDEQCMLSNGDIQCDGTFTFKETVSYKLDAELNQIRIPFPHSHEPVQVAHAAILFANQERSIDVSGFRYKATVGKRFLLSETSREGQWFWRMNADFETLDLDEFVDRFWRKKETTNDGAKTEDRRERASDESLSPEKKTPGPFVRLIHFLHDKYVQAAISASSLKVVGYGLQDFFVRFEHQGTHGKIRGLNFLTPSGYGAMDVDWAEMDKGNILMKVRPLAKNLDFGKILTGLLKRDSPFTGWLSFHGELKGIGKSFMGVRRHVSGYLAAEFKDGVIKHWKVLSDIFALINIYDILKGFPDFSKEGLAYRKIKGTINVKEGIAKTDDAHLESRPFYIGGQGQLKLDDGMLKLLIGVYPFKVIDKIISKVPIVGRILTDENNRVLGYYFRVEGIVTHPNVTSVNLKSYGKNIFNIFKKIITLPIYPFLDHSKQEEKK